MSRARSGKQKSQDDVVSTNVRFDYSAIYNNNEDLESQLETRESRLMRAQYRHCVESEQVLKKAKQHADEMLSLKNALKSRDPNESSKRLARSADHRKRPSSLTQPSPREEHEKQEKTDEISVESDMLIHDVDHVDGGTSKPLNNLTMFLLSLRKFKSIKAGKKTDEKDCGKEDMPRQLKSSSTSGPSGKSKSKPKRPATVSVMQSRPVQHQASTCGPLDSLMTGDRSGQYGIHVKRDHSRSRRELEEISRLEQESKYGFVNKYEERRKKLLASCKNTKDLEGRIQMFLTGVDEFKKMYNETNSEEKVIMRAKSAQITRKSSMFW